jgi:DNA 3'-phosphatase
MAGWNQHETVYLYTPATELKVDIRGRSSFAIFDVEGTLVWSDRYEPRLISRGGWVFSNENVPSTLESLQQKGYTIIFYISEPGISRNKIRRFKNLTQEIFSHLTFEPWVVLATVNDQYAKPKGGILDFLIAKMGILAVTNLSFYIGDEVSPIAKFPWYRRSSLDSQMATSMGIKFYEPRQIFGDYTQPNVDESTSLIITTGQMGSGWEIAEVTYKGKLGLTVGDRNIVFIGIEDLRSMESPIVIPETEIYMVFGSNPKKVDRDLIRAKFELPKRAPEYKVYWYSRFSYTLGRNDRSFTEIFEDPRVSGEPWVRVA